MSDSDPMPHRVKEPTVNLWDIKGVSVDDETACTKSPNDSHWYLFYVGPGQSVLLCRWCAKVADEFLIETPEWSKNER